MNHQWKTVVIGFGQISHGMSEDQLMARYFTYATHAQVLSKHPLFRWEAVVDPSDTALAVAREKWGIPIAVASVDELTGRYEPDVAIISTPPAYRADILNKLPSVRAVFVEKPLGRTFQESKTFIEECKRRKLLVQVNFWRRGDEFFQRLAGGELAALIGKPLAVFGLYGSGLMNNGSHMIDFVRMLLGEISEVNILAQETTFAEGPISGDINLAFALQLEDGPTAVFQPLPFSFYRENSLDIWGEKGRLALYQESLGIYFYPRVKNRAVENEWEIASDRPQVFEPTCGQALYRMYDNIANGLCDGEELWSSGKSALRSEEIVHTLLDYLNKRG